MFFMQFYDQPTSPYERVSVFLIMVDWYFPKIPQLRRLFDIIYPVYHNANIVIITIIIFQFK